MDILALIAKLAVFFNLYGYPTIFFASLLEITPIGWVVPGGLILAIAGFFSGSRDGIELLPTILSGTLGAWFALLLAYALGTKTGMWLVKKLHQGKNARFAKKLLQKNGGVILTTSMLSNITRFWISYVAGVEKYNFTKFNIYALLSSLTWVSLMVVIGFIASFERENLVKILGSVGVFAWIFLLLAIVVLIKSIRHEYKHFRDDEPHDENN